ncbi:DUF4238 domain-containing protein [uncultured Methanolobus sp.]|uniref:DUF4238 domain-containing protein n=1 Tax=uncultured Methanolobus sp. TaxID=218300 RepID=UPI00374A62E7
MPAYKKQHYVPQFYLRNFSNDSTYVYSYHLDSKTSSKMLIRGYLISFQIPLF